MDTSVLCENLLAVDLEARRLMIPHRRELAVFLAVAAFTLLTFHRDLADPNHGNEWSRIALTFAVVEHGTFAIDPYARNTEDWARRDGHIYSNKAPGPALLAVPFYKLQRDLQSKIWDVADDDPAARNFALYVANLISTGLPTLLALALLFAALVRRFDATPLQAFAVCAAWGVGSIGFVYTTLFFGHQSSAAFFAIGMCLSLLECEGDGARRPKWIFLAGLAMGLSVAADYIAAQLVAVWTLWLAWRTKFDRKVLGAWVLGGLGPALILLSYNKLCFGGFFTTAYSDEVINPRWRALNTIESPNLSRLADITVRPFRGILYLTPVWALVLVGMERLRKNSNPALLAAAVAVVGQFLYLSMLPSAFGGFCIGPRYATALLPLAALLLLDAVRLVPRLFVTLATLSSIMMLIAILTDPLPHEAFKDPYKEWLVPLVEKNAHTAQMNLVRSVFDLTITQTIVAYLALFTFSFFWLRRRVGRSPDGNAK